MESNIEKVQESFATQAENFETSQINTTRQAFLEYTINCANPQKTDSVLDVAAGTCFCGRTIAPRAAVVTNLDATPEMLEIGKEKAREDGSFNMIYVVGDALALPFLDGGFDMAISRLALHHIPDAADVLPEMSRVVKSGGKVVILDLAATDEALREAEEELEVLHDPSHARILSTGELKDIYEKTGLKILQSEETYTEMTLDSWLDMTKTPPQNRQEITKRFKEELSGGAKTGLYPYIKNNEIYFKQHLQLIIGEKH